MPDIFLTRPRGTILLLLLSWATVCFATKPPITDLVFSADGDAVVTVSQAGVEVFGWPNLKKQRRIEASSANLHCLQFSPDGKRLAIGGGNPAEAGAVEVLDWRTGKSLLTLDDHEDSVTSLQWRTNDQVLSAGLDRAIYLSDVVGPQLVRSFTGHSRGLNAICLLEGGETFVSVGTDQSVRVWNVKSGQLIRSLNQHTKPIHAAVVRPSDGGLPMIATAAEDRTIRFWQPTIGRMVRYVRLSAVPLDLAWSADGSLLAAACDDGRVRIVDPDEVSVVDSLAAIEGWAYGIAAHPTDGSLAVGGTNGLVRRVRWKRKK